MTNRQSRRRWRVNSKIWNYYAITGYGTQHGNDVRACGGVCVYEVRLTKAGWEKRIVDSNGRHRSAGRADVISSELGKVLFKRARCNEKRTKA